MCCTRMDRPLLIAADDSGVTSFGLKSIIRFAFPIERSIAPGGTVSTVAVTPISDLI